jgi:hypothetical protein
MVALFKALLFARFELVPETRISLDGRVAPKFSQNASMSMTPDRYSTDAATAPCNVKDLADHTSIPGPRDGPRYWNREESNNTCKYCPPCMGQARYGAHCSRKLPLYKYVQVVAIMSEQKFVTGSSLIGGKAGQLTDSLDWHATDQGFGPARWTDPRG